MNSEKYCKVFIFCLPFINPHLGVFPREDCWRMKPLRPAQTHVHDVPGWEWPGPGEGKLVLFRQGHCSYMVFFLKKTIRNLGRGPIWVCGIAGNHLDLI